MEGAQQFGLNSPNLNLVNGKNIQQQANEGNDGADAEDNQLNRKLGIARFANNFSFVDLNVLPQEQREAIVEASARHLKEASELR